MESFRVIVPCSTSNLGPGFDTLGLALALTVRAEVEPADQLTVTKFPGGPGLFAPELAQLMTEAVRAFEEVATTKVAMKLSTHDNGELPIARGLGSSAVYLTAAVVAANCASGRPLTLEQVLALVSKLEGHSDNAAPCLLGGITASGFEGERVRVLRAPVPPRYRFVAMIPDLALATTKARAVLPDSVPRAVAVANMQRAIWLYDGIANDRPEQLRGAFADRLHQPYREPLVPFLPQAIVAAEAAGAYGAFLSGAGSTVIAVTDEAHARPVSETLLKVMAEFDLRGHVKTLLPDNQGTRVEEN